MKHAGSRGAVKEMLKHLGQRKGPSLDMTDMNNQVDAAKAARRGQRGAGPKGRALETEADERNNGPAEEMSEGPLEKTDEGE